MERRRLQLGTGITSILKNGAYLVGSNWIELALRALLVVAITRTLGPAEYGVWAYVMATYVFALSAAAFGLSPILGIALSQSPEEARPTVAAALVLQAVVLCLALVGLILFASTLGLQRVALALFLVLPAFLARGFSEFFRAVFVGIERADVHTAIRGTMRLCEVLLCIGFLISGAELFVLMIVHSATWVIEAYLCYRLLRRAFGALVVPFRRATIISIARRGASLGAIGALAGWMAAAPLLLFAPLASDASTFGAFALAIQINGLISGSLIGFFNAALPVLSRAVSNQDTRAEGYARISAILSISFCSLIAILAIPISNPLISSIFGEGFELTSALFVPAVLLAGAAVAPTGFSQRNLIRGVIWPTFVANIAGCLTILICFGPAVDQWNAIGAVAAAGLGWAIRAILIVLISTTIFPSNER